MTPIMMTQEEQFALIEGLKAKWEKVNTDYQVTTFFILGLRFTPASFCLQKQAGFRPWSSLHSGLLNTDNNFPSFFPPHVGQVLFLSALQLVGS